MAPIKRILMTAGPTHEAIDDVRYLANRSSGRMGIAMADEAAMRGWQTTLLLGPTSLAPDHADVQVHRFVSTNDLQNLLTSHWEACDILVMAAAVADYRPASRQHGKIRRNDARRTLDLEPTPDLVASLTPMRQPNQMVVGFALESPTNLLDAARRKLTSKGLDAIVANPLATMNAERVTATMLLADGTERTPQPNLTKAEFASWLLDEIAALHDRQISGNS